LASREGLEAAARLAIQKKMIIQTDCTSPLRGFGRRQKKLGLKVLIVEGFRF
jgi:hypothetical protein